MMPQYGRPKVGIGRGRRRKEEPMPTKTQRSKREAKPLDAEQTRIRKDGDWDERLRLVGDARFVDVEWSGRDHPCWPLPKRQGD
jgi:hypothetical protein